MIKIDANNMMIMDGQVHALTKQEVSDPDAPLGNPCSLCSLNEYCQPSGHPICLLLDATVEEYFCQVGFVSYNDDGIFNGIGFYDGIEPNI